VIERKSVDQPVQTGLKSIDCMVPIAAVQRELDHWRPPARQDPGRRSTPSSPEGHRRECIYVASARRHLRLPTVVRKLEEHGRWITPSVVAATAAERPPRMRTSHRMPAAPWANTSANIGEDALIVTTI